MSKKIITMSLEDDYAYIQNEMYEKEEIKKALKTLKHDNKKVMVKKSETEQKLLYTLSFEKNKIHVIISKKYMEQNKHFVEILDKWYSTNRKQYFRSLKAYAIVASISVGGVAAFHEPIKEKLNNIIEYLNDLLTDEVGDLEKEIYIHAEHYNNPDGRSVSAQYAHECVLSSDKTISVPDGIQLYCEEHNLEYLEEAALQKYEYLYNDKIELGNAINLKQIEKKQKQKIKN